MVEKKKKLTLREKIKDRVVETKKKIGNFVVNHQKGIFWSLFVLLFLGSAARTYMNSFVSDSNRNPEETGDADANHNTDSSPSFAPMKCPNCETVLTPDAPEGWFNCRFCGDRFYYDGTILKSRDDLESSDNGQVCENCGVSLRGGEYTGAWDDGNNEYPYVICRNCHHKNILWQFGDD